MKKYYVALTLFAGLTLLMTGCGLRQEIKDTRNVALDTLNDAIQKMGQQSNRWQDVLEETRDKLVKDGQSTLANEVSNVLSRASSDVGIEAKCYTDFLRDRTKEDLIRLRATITQEKLALKPVFCNPTPNSIDLNIAPDRRPVIEIAGYNLTQNAIKVFLVERESPQSGRTVAAPTANLAGTSQRRDLRVISQKKFNPSYLSLASGKIDVSDKLSNPSSYLLTLNLGSNGVPLSANSDKILFELPNGEVKSISVIQPPPPPPKPEFLSSRIHVTGTIDMNDDENIASDENKSVRVDSYIEVKHDQNTPYHWEDCVGGEVQGYVDAQLQLDRNTGLVSGQGIGKYYEGTRCGATNEHGSRPFNFSLQPGESYTYQATLEDDDGHMIYNLNFKHEN